MTIDIVFKCECEFVGLKCKVLTSCGRKPANNGRVVLEKHALIASPYHLMLANAQKLVPTNDYKSTYRLFHDLMLHLKHMENKSKPN